VRLFVAVYPPPAALAHLDAALAPCTPDWPGLRWAPVEQWHLTLAFLGEVPDDRVDGLAERLARAAGRTPAMRLRLARFGAFPSARRARVCWAGVEGDVEPLRLLAARASAAARRAGIDVDDKPYRPHLTLARPRRPPLDVSGLAAAVGDYAGPWWPADAVRLVRSHLGAQVRHESLAAWSLSYQA
jgi:RNA 2',3'-cyclic 3'-phosphodiesterase